MVFMWYYHGANDKQHGEVDVRSGNLPSVLNYYVSTVGIKESLPYEQFDYNGGTASVNLINGALTATFKALSIDTPKNPLSLELVYNDNYNEIMDEFGMYKMFGNNMKITFQQAKLSEERVVRYVDADGSIDSLFQPVSSDYPAYYSVDNSLVLFSTNEKMNIGGRTRLEFNGNRAEHFVDTSFAENNEFMYSIDFSLNKITRISGYTDGQITHYITFTYSGDYVSSAHSYVKSGTNGSFLALTDCNFYYDDDGNLTEIKNVNSGNRKFALNYEDGKLDGIIDFDSNGYLFSRALWTNNSPMRMSGVNYIYGDSADYDEHFSYNYVDFSGNETTTTVDYYSVEENRLGMRSVSRRFSQWSQSEYYKDADGEITITASNASMSGTSDRETSIYRRNVYSTVEKQNTSLSGSSYSSVDKNGGSATCTISSGHGVEYKSGRQYAVSMFIETLGTVYLEIFVGGASRAKLSINGKTQSYFIIPTSYHAGATEVKVINYGSNYAYISNVSYNYYTSSQTVKRLLFTEYKNYISNVEQRDLNYKYVTEYDYLGQVTGGSKTDYNGSGVADNYTYTYEPYPDVTPASDSDVKRLKSVTDGTDEVVYTYSDNVTTTTVKKDGSPFSKSVYEQSSGISSYYVNRTENGETTRVDYAVKNGNIRPYKVTKGDQVIEYTYNYDGEITSISQGDMLQTTIYSDGKEVGYWFSYDDRFSLTRDSSKFGLVTAIKHNGLGMSIQYTENGDIDLKTFANGATIDYKYNYRDLTSVELKDSATSIPTVISYVYDGDDLTGVTQSYNGVAQLSYLFNDTKTQLSTSVSGDVNANYVYNFNAETGLPESSSVNLDNGASVRTENYVYNDKGLLQEIGNADFKTTYVYDSFNRVTKVSQVINGSVKQKIGISYYDTSDYISTQVKYFINENSYCPQNYSYNSNGYISSYNDVKTRANGSYTYDNYGRLITDGTYTYTYDNFNNIVKKVGNGKTYEYSYWSANKTRLKCIAEDGVAGEVFAYDDSENILNYKSATQNLFWTRGNMLQSGSVKQGVSFAYKYGADNLRYSKTVNGVETVYYWDNGTLIGEKTGNNYTQYLYDLSGIIGMIYNGSYYFFEKNLFGDVLLAYNANGIEVARFEYDSYGNLVSSIGSMLDEVKFRYRGYYYDAETDFYYLHTRYYSPEICRFISADQPELVATLSQTLGQLNLFAYCNNPIMYTDPDGEGLFGVFLFLGIWTIIGLSVGGTVGYLRGDTGWDLAKDFAIGAALGLATGGILLAGGSAIFGAINAVSKSANILVFGMATQRTFAIGALAYNTVAMAIAPLLGFEMMIIDFKNDPYEPDGPGETPRHPGERRTYCIYRGKYNVQI